MRLFNEAIHRSELPGKRSSSLSHLNHVLLAYLLWLHAVEPIGAEPVLFPFTCADVHVASKLTIDVTLYRATTVDEDEKEMKKWVEGDITNIISKRERFICMLYLKDKKGAYC
jgi:uncharacterized damage-inducible protein DinB